MLILVDSFRFLAKRPETSMRASQNRFCADSVCRHRLLAEICHFLLFWAAVAAACLYSLSPASIQPISQ